MEAISVSDFSPRDREQSRKCKSYLYLGSTARGKSQRRTLCFKALDRKEIVSEAASKGRRR